MFLSFQNIIQAAINKHFLKKNLPSCEVFPESNNLKLALVIVSFSVLTFFKKYFMAFC